MSQLSTFRTSKTKFLPQIDDSFCHTLHGPLICIIPNYRTSTLQTSSHHPSGAGRWNEDSRAKNSPRYLFMWAPGIYECLAYKICLGWRKRLHHEMSIRRLQKKKQTLLFREKAETLWCELPYVVSAFPNISLFAFHFILSCALKDLSWFLIFTFWVIVWFFPFCIGNNGLSTTWLSIKTEWFPSKLREILNHVNVLSLTINGFFFHIVFLSLGSIFEEKSAWGLLFWPSSHNFI